MTVKMEEISKYIMKKIISRGKKEKIKYIKLR